MSTYYSQASGAWSLMSNWNTAANGSGSTPANLAAFDNNSVVIQAPHAIMCVVDFVRGHYMFVILINAGHKTP